MLSTLSWRHRRFKRSHFFKLSLLFISLHISFIVALGQITAFAPDEGGYAAIFKNLYTSNFSLDGYLGWSSTKVFFLQILFLPAKVLNLIGFSEIVSIRILSLVCAYLAFFLLFKQSKKNTLLRIKDSWWLVISFFMPSIFLWTSLGLRESFIFLWLTSIYYFVSKTLESQSSVQVVFLTLASIALFQTKIYLYALVVISLTAATFVVWIKTRSFQRIHLKVVAAVLLPILLFPSVGTALVGSATGTISAKLVEPTPTPTPTPTSIPTSIPTSTGTELVAARGQTLHLLNAQLKNNGFLSWITKKTGIQKLLDAREKASYLLANSAEISENTAHLQVQPASLRDPRSIVRSTINFLFIPAPFIDNGSFFLNLQSYESLIWYLFYLFLILIIFGLIRGSIHADFVTISATFFTLLFILQSALVEINDGTSVRHRSVLLIGTLIAMVNHRRTKSEQIS